MAPRLLRLQPLLLLLLLLVFSLGACETPLLRPNPTPPPGVAGELTIYTPMGESLADSYLSSFRRANPRVEITLVPLSTGGTLERLLAEKQSPQADVVWGLSGTLMSLLEWQDVLRPYAPEGVERIYTQFRDSNTPPYWVGYGAWMSTFCVNPEQLEKLELPKPDSWESLFDPVYEGQIVMPSPVASGTGYMIVEAILELFGEVDGWEHLEALDDNVVNYLDSSTSACRMASEGEVAIGISHEFAASTLIGEGAPIEAVFAAEGVGWDIEASALIAKENPSEVAQIFLDWAISDEAMELYGTTRALLATPMEDHKPPAGIPEQPLTLLYDKDFPWASANRDRIVNEWLARFTEKLESN